MERTKPDWDGVLRDTGVVFGSQIFAGGIIYLLPESVSGWSKEEKRNAFDNYDENVRELVVDKDKFYINYILHPYWGAAYYIRARERGVDKDGAALYSTLMSAMWEFGVESFFEKPSIQDLIVTPAAGSLIGIYLFEPLRASLKRKQQLRWYDEALLVITDPLGVVSSGIEKMFGVKATVSLGSPPPQYERTAPAARIGLIVQFPLK